MKDLYRRLSHSVLLISGAFLFAEAEAQEADIPPPSPEMTEENIVGETDVVVESEALMVDEAAMTRPSDETILVEEPVEIEESVVVEETPETITETTTIQPAPRKAEVIPYTEPDSFYENYIKGRLSIGTRMLWYTLTDTESGEEFNGSFIGSLNQTTEEQDPAPFYIYLEYAITPYFGLGISYDQFKVKTLDSGGGDGTFDLSGPILYGFGRFENGSAYTPFAEIGVAFYGVDFNPRDEWTFSDGGSNVINRFETENTTGFVLGGGLDIQIIEHLSANIYLRYVATDIDVDYYFTPNSNTNPTATATFPGDHFAYGIGLKYTF